VRALSQSLEVGTAEVDTLLTELGARLTERQSGLVLRNVAGGWRLYAGDTGAEWIERRLLAGRSGRLSQAALETLAVIAYKQPISRSEIGDIRGVNADGAVRSLVGRGLVEEVGRDEGPGQAVLYGTTTEFLEKLGVNDVTDLPDLTDYLADDAPDEPAPSMFKQARRRLQDGEELPATGRARWDPQEDPVTATADGDDLDVPPDDETEGSGVTRRSDEVRRRREQEDEMEALTGALERAAKNAMAQLRVAVEAQADDDDEAEPGAEPEADESAAGTGTTTEDAGDA
jgi:segregation and condensation protein B